MTESDLVNDESDLENDAVKTLDYHFSQSGLLVHIMHLFPRKGSLLISHNSFRLNY